MLNKMKSRNTGKGLLFTIIALFNCCLFAQTLDPYKFFPSSVGNVWEYDQVWGFAREEIYKDSISENGNRYLFYKYNNYYTPTPRYKVDPTNYSIYRLVPDRLFFKLDSDSGDVWIVDSLNPGAGTIYRLALCRNQYKGFFFTYSTTFKEITFYQYQADTVINEFSWPDFTITLAYGIGEVMQFDEEGGGPERILQGCIIDGDTIGIITSVEDEFNSLNSFELFQNYPNPFNPSTKISWQSPVGSWQTLKVYDILGNEVVTLVDEYRNAGFYEIDFQSSVGSHQLANGVYFYRLQAGNFVQTNKMIYLK